MLSLSSSPSLSFAEQAAAIACVFLNELHAYHRSVAAVANGDTAVQSGERKGERELSLCVRRLHYKTQLRHFVCCQIQSIMPPSAEQAYFQLTVPKGLSLCHLVSGVWW